MTTYSAITAGEIDADSPITTGLMTKMRDNPIAITEGASGAPQIQTAALANLAVTGPKIAADAVDGPKIAANAIGNSELASNAVKQTNVDTSTAVNSVANPNTSTAKSAFTATGGTSIIGWEMYTDDSAGVDEAIIYIGEDTISSLSGSYVALYTLTVNTSANATGSTYARHTYISASPPYKIGDTDYPHFVYLHYNKDGKVVACSSAPDAPWAYNGPTEVKATRYGKNGEQFISRVEIPDEIKALKKTDLKNYYKEKKKLKKTEVLLTPEMKNADLSLVPAPYKADPGEKVVLIAPDDDIMEFFCCCHEDREESIHDLFLNGYLRLGEEVTLAQQLPGVSIVKAKFK